MTVHEAEKLLNIDSAVSRIDRISESNNYFIFSIVPKNANTKSLRSFAPSIAVDKHTGKTLAFNPMRFPKDELNTIRRIR